MSPKQKSGGWRCSVGPIRARLGKIASLVRESKGIENRKKAAREALGQMAAHGLMLRTIRSEEPGRSTVEIETACSAASYECNGLRLHVRQPNGQLAWSADVSQSTYGSKAHTWVDTLGEWHLTDGHKRQAQGSRTNLAELAQVVRTMLDAESGWAEALEEAPPLPQCTTVP